MWVREKVKRNLWVRELVKTTEEAFQLLQLHVFRWSTSKPEGADDEFLFSLHCHCHFFHISSAHGSWHGPARSNSARFDNFYISTFIAFCWPKKNFYCIFFDQFFLIALLTKKNTVISFIDKKNFYCIQSKIISIYLLKIEEDVVSSKICHF